MHKLEPPEPNKDCCGLMHNFSSIKKLKKIIISILIFLTHQIYLKIK